MKHTVATAAATAFTVAWSLLSAFRVPEMAPAVFVAMSPRHVEASSDETVRQSPQDGARAAQAPVPSSDTIEALITRYAGKYGVNPGVMHFTVSCETAGTFDPTIQSEARYTADHPEWGVKAGDREQSYGLAQIHIPSNRGVTRAQASDADYALDFMARHMAAGEYWRWSCLK